MTRPVDFFTPSSARVAIDAEGNEARAGWVEKELETTVDASFNCLAELDELFAAGKVAETQYWKQRLDLKARLMATLKRAWPSLLECYATRHITSR
jgi:hypothetical protein